MVHYTIKEVEVLLNTSASNGLSSKEANRRLARDGYNVLDEGQRKTFIHEFIAQFKDPMVFILLCASCLSILLQEYLDCVIILFVVVMNALIGSLQMMKSEKAMQALKAMMQETSKVIRDGKLSKLNSKEIVVGDLIVLEAGDSVPCDIRLVSTSHLSMDESMLTGESVAVAKNEFFRGQEGIDLSDQVNMGFMSTYVSSGRASGIAVGTAMNSEVGKIASMLNANQTTLTPLQERMNRLSKQLGTLAIVVCAIMFLVGILEGKDLFQMLILSISLAVAAIPEGMLAVVSIVLSMGVSSMSKKKAIVRHLHAIETLGSVSVICSDKTGTLTQNKMSVVENYCDDVFGGKLSNEMLQCMALCHNVSEDGLIGDSSEKALVSYADKFVSRAQLSCEYIRVDELSFDSMRKKMSTIHQKHANYFVFSKGSSEAILAQCKYVLVNGRIKLLNDYELKRIQNAVSHLEKQAFRVFAFSMKKSNEALHAETEHIFLGLVGLMDPLRKEVSAAVKKCQQAHIKVVMITGDSLNTASAIAKQLGLLDSTKTSLVGNQIEAMSDEELILACHKAVVFARVSPTHKVRIVSAFQKLGQIVSMSGDGVNDAPALKHANIGVAMGLTGSDVCKEAADMILMDDNFSTIVKAVESGRNIYLKIQKSIFYLLSCNLGEMLSIFMAILLMKSDIPPILAIQILWINLVTDALPALALGIEPDEKNIMKNKPRDSKESLFAHGGAIFVVCNGLLIGTITLVAFKYGWNSSVVAAQTMAFMVLSISQMFHALNCRQIHASMFKIGFFSNRSLLFIVTSGILLQVLVCQLPFMNSLLKTTPLSLIQWAVVFGLSISVVVVNEISKLFTKD